MRYSRDKTINEIVKSLVKGNWFVKSTHRHVKLEHSVTRDVITVPGSPSNHRSLQNWIHQVRNYGEPV